jgi:oligoendopeptidase F
MSEAMIVQTLPVWDLSDLYTGPDSPLLQADLEEADASARAFKDRYTSKLATS